MARDLRPGRARRRRRRPWRWPRTRRRDWRRRCPQRPRPSCSTCRPVAGPGPPGLLLLLYFFPFFSLLYLLLSCPRRCLRRCLHRCPRRRPRRRPRACVAKARKSLASQRDRCLYRRLVRASRRSLPAAPPSGSPCPRRRPHAWATGARKSLAFSTRSLSLSPPPSRVASQPIASEIHSRTCIGPINHRPRVAACRTAIEITTSSPASRTRGARTTPPRLRSAGRSLRRQRRSASPSAPSRCPGTEVDSRLPWAIQSSSSRML